jgi:hypothetical protein
MSNFHFKKKVSKSENPFFLRFFLRHFFSFFCMINDNTTFGEIDLETISFFPKKTHFFRFFRLFSETSKKFSGSFWPQKNEHHSFFRPF